VLAVRSVELQEVGPREGFQFEGIGQPDKISTANKVRLVNALSDTGLRTIQVTSFVHPRWVPQMADAEAVSAAFERRPGVKYTAIYLNDKGFERALATGKYDMEGLVSLTASETFSKRNQNRTYEEDLIMQRKQLVLYRENGVTARGGMLLAAFGCNYEGDIPLARVLQLIDVMHELMAEAGQRLDELLVADTMGWATPTQIRQTIVSIKERWPRLELALHLHDTRGMGIANVYAGLEAGVSRFDTSIGGLGGCPFAGVAAGNVATEDVVFMCQRMGIETGIDLRKLVDCAKLAEEIVGHTLPARVSHIA